MALVPVPVLVAATAFPMIVMMVFVTMMPMRMMMPVIGMAMIRHRAIRMLHTAVGQMGVIVMVAVDRKRLGRSAAEQPHIFRTLAYRLRRSPAADMSVQAYDGIGFRHHHMQVMRD